MESDTSLGAGAEVVEADAAQRDSRDAELLAEVEIGDGGLQTLDAVDARLREVIAG